MQKFESLGRGWMLNSKLPRAISTGSTVLVSLWALIRGYCDSKVFFMRSYPREVFLRRQPMHIAPIPTFYAPISYVLRPHSYVLAD